MAHHAHDEHTDDCGCEEQAAKQATAETPTDQPQQAIETLENAGDTPVRP